MKNKYYIANESDRPHKNCVTQRFGDRIYYIHESLRDVFIYRNGFSLNDRPTPLEDFGFDILENSDGTVIFTLMRESCATYTDGKQRRWQGNETFTLTMLDMIKPDKDYVLDDLDRELIKKIKIAVTKSEDILDALDNDDLRDAAILLYRICI